MRAEEIFKKLPHVRTMRKPNEGFCTVIITSVDNRIIFVRLTDDGLLSVSSWEGTREVPLLQDVFVREHT